VSAGELTARERFVGWVCSRLLELYFRRIEVVGAERIPERGPFLVVANHVNGLLDPMFVFGPLGIPARTLGKSTLWKIPGIAQLADLAGGIPVHRRIDPGADPAKNVEAFAAAHEVLARDGIIAIFPEGISHDEPRLQPLRTGAARILLEAERLRGPLGIRILPVGLVFERREGFRSRALVVVGEPFDPASRSARSPSATSRPPCAALTARIKAALGRSRSTSRPGRRRAWSSWAPAVYHRAHGGGEAGGRWLRDFALHRA
jgi:1-acyl-sn-glycerol-3-phosphate acyltransferase